MPWFALKMTLINTLFWLTCCFGIAYGIRMIPGSSFERHAWFFRERSFEKKLYQTIHLDKWKDYMPELGKILNFEKKHLKELSIEYLNLFILETYYAEAGHLSIAVLGFCCILVNPRDYAQMAIILSVINLIIQIPFCLIQRYNRPRLIKVRSRLAQKKNAENHLKM